MDSYQAILLTNALKVSPAAFEEAYLNHNDCYLFNRLDSFTYTHVLSKKEKVCIERLKSIRDWANGISETRPSIEGL